METVYYPYLGRGKIYARVAGTTTGLLPLGNASKLELASKENKQTQKDMTALGGGTYASVTRIDSVSVQGVLHDLNKVNFARAVFGSASTVAGAAVLDETVVAYKGAIVPLAHPNPTDVTVTNSAGTTTYTQADYEIRAGGIFITDAGAIADAQELKVDYSFGSYHKVEAMTASAVTLELHFEGLNEALSGRPVILDIWRAQLSPAKAIALLGDKFAELPFEAEVLKDPTKTGVGISQFFRTLLC